ncbi:MAG TPA: hypothetical protein PKW83_07980 [Verrucomicrobiota bacterium]|nr:hypothetical protein [Verrucomicrobiota bacterium]
MTNHTRVMNVHEARRLAELEKMIARGKQTFVEVGLALAEIRDLRLYKGEYSSFREYCQKKWGWEKRYTNYVIAGAEAVRSLPEKVGTAVPTLAAARELARVPTAQRGEVVQAIAAEGLAVTAPAIKRRLPPPPMQRRGANGSGRTAPPPPSQVLDATGWPIPTQLIPLWQRAGEVQEWLTTLSRLKGVLRTAQNEKDPLYAEVSYSSALSQLDQVWTDIKTAKPFAVCPACQGQVSDKCTLCRGRGLISEFRWNTCVTREDKEFREKAKSGKVKR